MSWDIEFARFIQLIHIFTVFDSWQLAIEQKTMQYVKRQGPTILGCLIIFCGTLGCSFMTPRMDLATLTMAAEIERRGDQFFQEGNYSAAAVRFEEAAGLIATDHVVRRKLADTYWEQSHHQAAIASMQGAIDLVDSELDSELRQQWLVRLGEMYSDLGNVSSALAAVNQVIAENPQLLSARILRGTIYERIQSFDQALEDFHYALGLVTPETGAIRDQLEISVAGIYSKQRRTNRVLSITSGIDTRSLEPQQAIKVHLMRAIALRDRGRYAEAVRELRELLELDGADPQAHFVLATTYWEQGDLIRCQQAILQTLQISPHHPGAIRLQQDIDRQQQS